MIDEETRRRLDRIEEMLEQLIKMMADELYGVEDEEDEALMEEALRRTDYRKWIT